MEDRILASMNTLIKDALRIILNGRTTFRKIKPSHGLEGVGGVNTKYPSEEEKYYSPVSA